MKTYVSDTQAIVKHLTDLKVIKIEIDTIFKQADIGEARILIPAPVLFEIGYLNEKGRIKVSIADMNQLFQQNPFYREQSLDFDMIKSSFEIIDIKELHDKLIAGTARQLNLPILTNDPIIKASQFVTCI